MSFIAGCELPAINVPSNPTQVVIHGILTRDAATQTVLIERTLTGETGVIIGFVSSGPNLEPIGALDAAEPLLSDGGVPERNAVVTLTLPSGQVLTAPELANVPLAYSGAGVYRFALPGTSLVGGGTYTLRVVTTEGETVTAQTVIPAATPLATATLATFNRDADTLRPSWSAVPGARNYLLTIDNTFQSWMAFTDSTHATISGLLRNVNTDRLTRVFLPGFRQTATVLAVDANMYDYYRSTNNGFTGAGVISHVSGGYGLFGSVVQIARYPLAVVAPTHLPIEGVFNLLPDPKLGLYGGEADAQSLTIYVESPSGAPNQLGALTATYRTTFNAVHGTVGTLSGTHMQLAFLHGQVLSDTTDVLTADLRGDTLVGIFHKDAPARYLRQ